MRRELWQPAPTASAAADRAANEVVPGKWGRGRMRTSVRVECRSHQTLLRGFRFVNFDAKTTVSTFLDIFTPSTQRDQYNWSLLCHGRVRSRPRTFHDRRNSRIGTPAMVGWGLRRGATPRHASSARIKSSGLTNQACVNNHTETCSPESEKIAIERKSLDQPISSTNDLIRCPHSATCRPREFAIPSSSLIELKLVILTP